MVDIEFAYSSAQGLFWNFSAYRQVAVPVALADGWREQVRDAFARAAAAPRR